MKELVIAEKPSVARDIARVLKCQKQLNGAMEGEKYIVTWGLGHLVTLADPEDYDKKYKEWKLEDLPMMPETFRLEVIRQTAKQYNAVKEQIHRKDVGGIIIATDAGREGELVARLILKKAGARKPLKRLWISSVTDKAIREGFAHLKDGREYEPLYDAAMCRAEADWLVDQRHPGADMQIQCPAFLRPRPDADAGHDRQPGGGDPPLCAKALLRDPRPGRQPHPGLEGQKERQRKLLPEGEDREYP